MCDAHSNWCFRNTLRSAHLLLLRTQITFQCVAGAVRYPPKRHQSIAVHTAPLIETAEYRILSNGRIFFNTNVAIGSSHIHNLSKAIATGFQMALMHIVRV